MNEHCCALRTLVQMHAHLSHALELCAFLCPLEPMMSQLSGWGFPVQT